MLNIPVQPFILQPGSLAREQKRTMGPAGRVGLGAACDSPR